MEDWGEAMHPPLSPAAEPLRIAAVSGNLEIGGATTFLLNLQGAWRGGPHHLRILGFTEARDLAADFAAAGADLHARRITPLIYEDRLASVAALLAELRPHAVLACLGGESFEMLRLAPPGVARIGLVQADDPAVYALASRYAKWIDAMVGVSEGIARQLRGMPEFQGKAVAAIPYGILFEAPRVRVPSSGPFRVVYVGRIVEVQKRISRLVELIARLPASEFHFTIVGGGPNDAEFRAAVGHRDNVTLLGPLLNSQITPLLAEQDAFVLLSDFEGLPLSLLEAMGAGVVPVISDLPGGMQEAVPPECGVRVPVGDVEAAARALRGLAGDRERVAVLSVAAAERARRLYSAQTMGERYVELIRSLHPQATEWAAAAQIPPPLGLQPWLYSGPLRHVRRLLKKLSRRRSAP